GCSSKDEMLGKNTLEFIAERDHERARESLKKTLEQGCVKDIEYTFLTKDGGEFPAELSASVTKDAYGSPTGFVVMARGMTERKRAEEALQESEERYRSLFEGVPVGLYRTTPEGQIIDVNPALVQMLGYPDRQALLAVNITDVYLDPEERRRWQALMEREGVVRDFEARLCRRDETIIWVRNSSRAVRDGDSRVLYYEGSLEDITKRKVAEEERERLLAELEAKNKELESFVYTVSHDLKAPLISLDGFSSALQEEFHPQLGEEGKHYVERIQANVARMDALIMHLLDLSRIGRVVGPIEEIDVVALLSEIQEELAVELEEAGAELVVQEPLPAVRADRGRVHQVFANLIDNAVKFRSEERPLRIEVGCRKERGFYRFHVADNGIGIAPQYHEQIFAPFRQLDSEAQGVGMGLALVKKIVEHHG
ncbi:MAG: PAS domain S-box protein, partial [Anaerolineae bacterium]|nr:PAS domain S-box protein [Anaerolineae bacterium]NIO00500.1 PAS domain S-box protein [Anaerolineae bacterium]NIQ83238.1 PAS domain S-box protein [Anaerolineae bacterium]